MGYMGIDLFHHHLHHYIPGINDIVPAARACRNRLPDTDIEGMDAHMDVPDWLPA